ncbi:MAG: acyltransferase [Massilia sp.]|uniref:acyltransferase family protein n=1 Tax=Massilia sp. TaxID=1882437 RepID=UPI002FC91C31
MIAPHQARQQYPGKHMKSTPTPTPSTLQQYPTEFATINLLKAISAQLIVLHHLAFYGPMADYTREALPDLIDWLAQDARIAVQVFLVIGGFLAAKSLSPQALSGPANPLKTILRRYTKLAPPFFVAILLAVAASWLAGLWMTHDAISAPPSGGQLLAHAFLLHDVLGYDALSAGAWYVAIDLQLYAMFSVLLWACSRASAQPMAAYLIPALTAIAAGASLLYFNLDADWDVWAPYFLGSYGMGALAWWARDPARRPRSTAVVLLMMTAPALLALTVDFRSRIALALIVACSLVVFGRVRTAVTARGQWRVIRVAGNISFSVFLVHFPVCLVINAAFTRFAPQDVFVQTGGVILAWIASMIAGALFHHGVELPIGRTLTWAPERRTVLA